MTDYNDSDRILNSETKEVEKATGELSNLFRKILKHRNVGVLNWDSLMEYYLNDPSNQIPPNGKDRSSTRGNMNKALMHESMTWKVFKKALKFVGVMSFRIEIYTTWKDRTTTVEKVTRVLSKQYLGDEEEEAKD